MIFDAAYPPKGGLVGFFTRPLPGGIGANAN